MPPSASQEPVWMWLTWVLLAGAPVMRTTTAVCPPCAVRVEAPMTRVPPVGLSAARAAVWASAVPPSAASHTPTSPATSAPLAIPGIVAPFPGAAYRAAGPPVGFRCGAREAQGGSEQLEGGANDEG